MDVREADDGELAQGVRMFGVGDWGDEVLHRVNGKWLIPRVGRGEGQDVPKMSCSSIGEESSSSSEEEDWNDDESHGWLG